MTDKEQYDIRMTMVGIGYQSLMENLNGVKQYNVVDIIGNDVDVKYLKYDDVIKLIGRTFGIWTPATLKLKSIPFPASSTLDDDEKALMVDMINGGCGDDFDENDEDEDI